MSGPPLFSDGDETHLAWIRGCVLGERRLDG